LIFLRGEIPEERQEIPSGYYEVFPVVRGNFKGNDAVEMPAVFLFSGRFAGDL